MFFQFVVVVVLLLRSVNRKKYMHFSFAMAADMH